MWRRPQSALFLLVAVLQFAAVCHLAVAATHSEAAPALLLIASGESRPAVPTVERRILRAAELLRESSGRLTAVLLDAFMDDDSAIGKGWSDSLVASSAADSHAPSLQSRHTRLQI